MTGFTRVFLFVIVLHIFSLQGTLRAQTLGTSRDETAPLITQSVTNFPGSLSGYCRIAASVQLHVRAYTISSSIYFESYHPANYSIQIQVEENARLEFDLAQGQVMYFYFPTTGEGTSLILESDGPLPVTLTTFAARVSAGDVLLLWKTATELNLNRFEVERDRVTEPIMKNNYQNIGFVTASGYSNAPKEYTYRDRYLYSGKFSYRLKMLDNDGTYSYSEEILVDIAKPSNTDLKQNYPNTFNPATTIEYQIANRSSVRLELYSLTGEMLQEMVSATLDAGYYVYRLDISTIRGGLPSGVYIYRMVAKDQVTGSTILKSKKMIVLK